MENNKYTPNSNDYVSEHFLKEHLRLKSSKHLRAFASTLVQRSAVDAQLSTFQNTFPFEMLLKKVSFELYGLSTKPRKLILSSTCGQNYKHILRTDKRAH